MDGFKILECLLLYFVVIGSDWIFFFKISIICKVYRDLILNVKCVFCIING